MKNFILSAAVIALAGASISKAGTTHANFNTLQDTTTKDTVSTPETPADTTKKSELYDVTAYATDAAQDTTTSATDNQPAPAPATETQKKEVNLTDLPDAVKQTLTADIFKEWVPSTAYEVAEGSQQYYQIEVKKDDEIRNIKIGADGKVVNQ